MDARSCPSLNIALVGEEAAGLRVFKQLVAGPHRLVAVLTTEPRGNDAGHGTYLWSFAAKLGHRTLPARSVVDQALAAWLREQRADVLLNVHSLHVVCAEVLAAPRIGSFNLHPGPLPRYAGLAAPSWALFHGETTHGVTLHWMAPAIDAGPIVYQRTFGISARDTGLSVSARCVQEGLPMIGSLLDACAADPALIPRRAQDPSQRQVFGRQPPWHGQIAWDRPAAQLAAFLRAADFHPLPSPWGHGRATYGDKPLEIVKAEVAHGPAAGAPGTVTATDAAGVVVACGEGSLLVTLVARGGSYRNAAEVLAPGTRLGPGGPP